VHCWSVPIEEVDPDLAGAYLGLDSTYRVLGQYEDSRRVFREGLKRFPAFRALSTLFALTLYNLAEQKAPGYQEGCYDRDGLMFDCVRRGSSRLSRPGTHEDDHEHQGQHGEGYGRPEPPPEAAE
jgi:hypothetical protein